VLFRRVLSVLGPVADRTAGLPTWRVKPALRQAWREVFDADLGEPTLTWVAQAIQDRQPAAIGWHDPDGPPGHPATTARSWRPVGVTRRSGARFPGEWRQADLELPATAGTVDRLPELLRTLLAAWGPDAQRLSEDAQLVVTAVLASALDRADPTSWPRLTVTFRPPTLRVCLTVQRAEDTGFTLPPGPVRHRQRAASLLLKTVAADRDRRAHEGTERIWFELRPRPTS
jgi:hypothetical protein